MRLASIGAVIGACIVCVGIAHADERFFTYNYETNVLPKGEWEFEQSITNQNGKEDGDYSEWNLRSEFETGLTDHLMTALYLNLDSINSFGAPEREDGVETKFKGVSSEWIYQMLNPNLDPIGLAGYVELTTDGLEHEIEWKLLASKPVENWIFVGNAVYEMEWERDDGHTTREGTLELDAGSSYRITPEWSVGAEFRNKQAYPDGFNLSGQEYNTISAGPNVHYGAPKWWATFTVLPQIWGNGEGSNGNRQLVHEESVEVRLIFGIAL